MRNSQDRYCYRHCKCIRCGEADSIFWSSVVPSGLVIECDVPCSCGDFDALLGDEVEFQPVAPEVHFNPADVLLH